VSGLREDFAFQTDIEFTLKMPLLPLGIRAFFIQDYFDGICAAPSAGGATGTGAAAGTEASVVGTFAAAPSSTLPELTGRALPK
jgi:hypothetical protein